MKIYSKDIIALVAILGGGYLLAIGHNGYVTAGLMMILGYYFTHRDKINGKKK